MCRHPAKTITVFIISHGNIPGILEIEMDDLLVMKRTNFTWVVYLTAARQVTRQNCEEISKDTKLRKQIVRTRRKMPTTARSGHTQASQKKKKR